LGIQIKRWLEAMFFVSPALVLIGFLVVMPAIQTLLLSFLDEEGRFVWLRNFSHILLSKDSLNLERFPRHSPPWGAIPHNAVWVLLHLPLTVMLGMILAVLLKEVKGASFIKSAIFLGMVTPMIIGGVMIRFLFDEHAGVINALLRLIGLGEFEKSWTAYPDTALLSLILGSIWLWTGFSMTLYSAGLATIPKELYEAADVDGANAIQKFIHITIPSLRPVTVTVVAMTMLWELKIFDIVYTATLGGPGGSSMVMALQMYFLAFRRLKPNLASVIATFLTALTLIIGVWFVRSVRRGGR
jgi:multiple sugar transport system permease protein